MAPPSNRTGNQLLATLVTQPDQRKDSNSGIVELCRETLGLRTLNQVRKELPKFEQLLTHCFEKTCPQNSKPAFAASHAQLPTLNALFLACAEDAEAARAFNVALREFGPYNGNFGPKWCWKVLEIYQIAFWVDVSTTRSETELLVAELVNYFLTNKRLVSSPPSALTLVWWLLTQSPSDIAKPMSFFGPSVPRGVLVLLSLFERSETRECLWIETTSSDFSYASLWSAQIYDRIGASKFIKVVPSVFDFSKLNEFHIPLNLWLLRRAKTIARQHGLAPHLQTQLSGLVNTVREQITAQPCVPQVVKERQEECLMLADQLHLSCCTNAAYLSYDAPSLTFLIRMLNDYEHVKIVNALDRLLDALLSLDPERTDLQPLATPLLEFLQCAVLDKLTPLAYMKLARVLTNVVIEDGPYVRSEPATRIVLLLLEMIEKAIVDADVIANAFAPPDSGTDSSSAEEEEEEEQQQQRHFPEKLRQTKFALIRNLLFVRPPNLIASRLAGEEDQLMNQFVDKNGRLILCPAYDTVSTLQRAFGVVNARCHLTPPKSLDEEVFLEISMSLVYSSGTKYDEHHRAGLELIKAAIADNKLDKTRWRYLLHMITMFLMKTVTSATADPVFLAEAASVALWFADMLVLSENYADIDLLEVWVDLTTSPAVSAADFSVRGLFQSVCAVISAACQQNSGETGN